MYKDYIKKRGITCRYPFHALRPSHCPIMSNEQLKTPRR